ncbi:MAG: cytidine deaminase [Bacteroidales bacterium]
MISANNISFTYLECERPDELNSEDQELILAAKTAAMNAYAPYSGFRVGAALRLVTGRIVKGSNVENAAFPSGICAERTAVSYSVANFPDDNIEAIAIAAVNEKGLTADIISPCGNCRQVLAEEENRTKKPIRIILSGSDRIRVIDSCSNLLPLQFSKENLTAGRS